MEERKLEGLPPNAEEAIPLRDADYKYKSKINCICRINGNLPGSGFFCKIKFEGKLTPVLITNYHVVNDDFMNQNTKLTFYVKDDVKDVLHSINIDKDSKIYSSTGNKYDMMIIRLKEGEVNNYLEIDENIFDNSVDDYKNEDIYILHHPNVEEAKISFGSGIKQENDYDIKHLCHTEPGSSGGPILSRITNKVIGIHKGSIDKYGKCAFNIGTFLKFPLNELKNQNKPKGNIHKCPKCGSYNTREVVYLYKKYEEEVKPEILLKLGLKPVVPPLLYKYGKKVYPEGQVLPEGIPIPEGYIGEKRCNDCGNEFEVYC